jgi:hypothetical protein
MEKHLSQAGDDGLSKGATQGSSGSDECFLPQSQGRRRRRICGFQNDANPC